MRVRIHWSRVVHTCAAVALAAVVSADSPAQAPSGGSRFIVRAVGSAGPIADLKREELSIKTDGKQREVKTLELVDTASASGAGPAPAPPPSTLPAPFATNAASPAASSAGREFLIVLDDEGIGAGREEPVRKAVALLMSTASPADHFGIIGLRVGGVAIPPTSDRQLVTGALDKFVGGGSASESAGEIICRARRALISLSEVLRGSPAGRVVLLVSPGLPATQTTTQRMSAANQGQTTELCQIRGSDLEELSVAAALSPASVYVLYYAEGLASPRNAAAAQQGIENIAGVVNGEWMRLVEGNDRGMTRIAKDTALYYIATLDDAPGAVRRIEARSSRDGLRLFVRPAGGARAAAPTAKVSSPRDMLRNATAFADLPLRAAGYLSREGAAGMKVVTLFEPVAADAKLTAASVGVIDDQGTLKWQWSAQPADLTGLRSRRRSRCPPASTASGSRRSLRTGRTGQSITTSTPRLQRPRR